MSSTARPSLQRVRRRRDLLVKVSGDLWEQTARKGNVPNLVVLCRVKREFPADIR